MGSEKKDVRPVYPKSSQQYYQVLAKHLRKVPISAAEKKAATAEVSVEAEEQGHCIIAVASDLAQDEAERLMGDVYREHRLRREEALDGGKKRPRSKQWLEVISQFENAEMSSGGTNARGFDPYRGIMDGIQFGSRQ
jgi:hypothetical protein